MRESCCARRTRRLGPLSEADVRVFAVRCSDVRVFAFPQGSSRVSRPPVVFGAGLTIARPQVSSPRVSRPPVVLGAGAAVAALACRAARESFARRRSRSFTHLRTGCLLVRWGWALSQAGNATEEGCGNAGPLRERGRSREIRCAERANARLSSRLAVFGGARRAAGSAWAMCGRAFGGVVLVLSRAGPTRAKPKVRRRVGVFLLLAFAARRQRSLAARPRVTPVPGAEVEQAWFRRAAEDGGTLGRRTGGDGAAKPLSIAKVWPCQAPRCQTPRSGPRASLRGRGRSGPGRARAGRAARSSPPGRRCWFFVRELLEQAGAVEKPKGKGGWRPRAGRKPAGVRRRRD